MRIVKTPLPMGIILIGLTPIFMVLLPWDFGNEVTTYRWFMRWKSVALVITELVFVFWSMTQGFSPLAKISAIDRLAKFGILVLIGIAIWNTIFVANNPSMASIAMFQFFAHFMFALALAHQFTTWTIEQRNLLWPAVGFGVIGFCLLWGINIYLYDPSGVDWLVFIPSMTIVRSAGFYSLGIFCAGIALFLSNHREMNTLLLRTLAVIFGSIGIAIGFWTGTRAAVVAIMAGVTLSSFIYLPRSSLFKYFLLTLIIGIGSAAALPVVHPAYGIQRVINASVQPSSADAFSSGRLQIWEDMTGKILDRPLMGWGIDQFGYSFPAGTPSIGQPHQGFMQLIFSSGLIGVAAALLILFAFVRRIPRTIKYPYQHASSVFVLGAVVYGSIDGFFYFAYPTMVFVIGAVGLIAGEPKPNVQNLSISHTTKI